MMIVRGIKYMYCLVLLGLPILTCEFAIGRGSNRSISQALNRLEQPGSRYHLTKYMGIAGNYLLMMFYTTISGWMLIYFIKYADGSILAYKSAEELGAVFGTMISNPVLMVCATFAVILVCFSICSFGLQKGVERITKWMMVALLLLMVGLAIYSCTLSNAAEGLKFYLVPDMQQIEQVGLFHIITNAMSQAFFTLSLGIGAMLIFGSYLNGGKSLLGEAVSIAALDTFVAITAGLIIFPACFSYNVQPDSGPKLIFMTLPHIFTSMKGGRIFGSFFFLFLFFAALSTIIAVFENIMCCFSEIFGVSRKQSAIINCILVILGSLPCALGYNVWSGFQPLGAGSTVLDLEDFIVSNLLLPVGSLIYLLFCTSKWGWGFKNYQAEANKGGGLKVPDWVRVYLSYILPLLLLVLIVQGLIG